MNDEEFLRLTTLYLEDAIDAGDLDLLNRDLADSLDRVRQFNDLRLLTGLINEHGREVESENAADLETNPCFTVPLAGGSGSKATGRATRATLSGAERPTLPEGERFRNIRYCVAVTPCNRNRIGGTGYSCIAFACLKLARYFTSAR